MAESRHEFALVGLGNIGGNLAAQALEKGCRVVGYDAHPPSAPLVEAGLQPVAQLAELADRLGPPRIVFLYVPAGPIVDQLLDQLLPILQPGDVVVDGGNSYWGDSIRRHRRLAAAKLGFVDLGTSGGLAGARHGACFMAGGKPEVVGRIEPILTILAVTGGYVHAGPPGAGHFAKLVHNGIEFGMLQAIGEGMDLLTHFPEPLPVAEILGAWGHGSVIRSWLIELMEQQYRQHPAMADVPGYVEDTGEVNWLVDDALQLEVPIPVIAQSVMQLLASRDASRGSARAVALMRHGFGNHPLGPDPRFASNRRTSRVGGFEARE